jgi:hypothetical protein
MAMTDRYQSLDCTGILAPQNLHFTGLLFWSNETLFTFLHAGHVRLCLRKFRRIAEIKNGFKFLTPHKHFVFY